jgi:uncharacterized protein with HEPN domain
MSPPDDIRIRHMIEAAERAVSFSEGRERSDLDENELLKFALVKLVEIVGEAAKLVSDETRRAMPQVAWMEAARMRDRLVHHYFDINLDVLWSTVVVDLPSLPEAVRREP